MNSAIPSLKKSMINYPKQIKELVSCGIPLHEMGINNWALDKSQVLKLLDEFEKIEVAVLGGDVCKITSQKLDLHGNNWSCDIKKSETKYDYVRRSISYTKSYISGYPNTSQNLVFFTIVPEIS